MLRAPAAHGVSSQAGDGSGSPPALTLPPSDSVSKNLNNCWTNDAPMSRANVSKIRSKRTNGHSSEFFMIQRCLKFPRTHWASKKICSHLIP